MNEKEVLLEIKHVKKYFPLKKGLMKKGDLQVKAVDDVSFCIYKGETLGIVGESGSGKSTLGRTIIRLFEPTEGEIFFKGQSIGSISSRMLHPIRKEMQMVFQDPFASLNPRMRVGNIVSEPLRVQTDMSKEEIEKTVRELMEKVGLNQEAVRKFPHEFSGGQRQRIGIARALAIKPKLIIADEPVSALDVSVQSQVLNLMQDLQEEFSLTYLFISHDLSVVKHISDRVAVMYLGRIVEIGEKQQIFERPLHPYTQALLSAIPTASFDQKKEKIALKGELPSPSDPPTGCAFHTRCPKAFDRCRRERPELRMQADGHYAACHLYDDLEKESSKEEIEKQLQLEM